MFVVNELFVSLIQVVQMLFTIYTYVVIARALISWVNPDPYNPIVQFLHRATDPPMGLIRRYVPCVFGGFDFSVIILLLLLNLTQRLVVAGLAQIAGLL